MSEKSIGYLIVNFGGPRTLSEVEPFLRSLLTDREVIRTRFPQFIHNSLFGKVAKKRAPIISKDYESIGGGSPIYDDTEYVADQLKERLKRPVLTFHRYLPATHPDAWDAINGLDCDEIHVFPMFPQFTYATTGSIARIFEKNLSEETLLKLRWVKSYPTHPAFVSVTQKLIREFLEKEDLAEEETFLFFSAHGLPRIFVETGDLYEEECQSSYQKVITGFPKSASILAYQSKFGPGEWLRPYTNEICENILDFALEKKNVLFVPISFTSDHIETLFEIEKQYMPVIQGKGLKTFRLPALNRRNEWIDAIQNILMDFNPLTNSMLVRR